ncbi:MULTISPECIES: hypothetical protein [unclassified Carboxylicivirga]|uniref:hypothetical protein n=1 Tax=Carboxylicivirga TaxID=1628153 RepID=UPI003D35205F
MKISSLVLSVLLMGSSLGVFAQSDLGSRFDSMSLKAQYDYVFDKSETYEHYKVVKRSTFNLLKKNSLDSVEVYKNELETRTNELLDLNKTLAAKDDKIKQLTEDLNAATNSKNSLVFLGMELGKSLYNTIMWGLVFGLITIAVVFFLMFKRSNFVTHETKSRLNEVEEEFETHRKSALKREQKLARELMDEKLKHKF